MSLPYGPPNEDLDRELRQVASAATEVGDTLDRLNAVPPDFPAASLKDLLAALVLLPEGTAENCRPQLELARNMLPKLRREHFGIETAPEGEPADGTPRLTRGMLLDQQLQGLLAAVTTALDEYRVQAGVSADDTVRPGDVAVPADPALAALGESRATAVAALLRQAAAQLDQHGASAVVPGDLLRRRVRDTQSLALSASAQLRQRKLVRRWFEAGVVAIRHMPNLIAAAGRGLRKGADAAGPLGEWWARVATEWIGTLIRQVGELGGTLEEVARRLSQPATPTADRDEALDPRDLAELARLGLPVSDDPERPGYLRIEATGALSRDSLPRSAALLGRVAGRVTTAIFGSS